MSDQKNGAPKVHSEEYFGEYRDFWWNLDFLKLMGERLNVAQVKTVLDVGCGRGHWGQLLAPIFAKDVSLIGIDREQTSLTHATERAAQRGLSLRYQYQQGDAVALSFPDNSFDMVTCQTLLIHLKKPKIALAEMLRVLRPKGILLVAEPNNFANRAVASNLTEALSVDEVMDRLRFDLHIQRGKQAMGLGYNSLGDFVPGYLAEIGAQNIQVYLSDKTSPYFPPYASLEQQVNIKQLEEWTSRDFLGWDREEMRAYYLAGGGEPNRFDFYWNLWLEDARAALSSIKANTYHSAGGGIQYLISASKN